MPFVRLLVVIKLEAILEFLEQRTSNLSLEDKPDLLNSKFISFLFEFVHLIIDVRMLDSESANEQIAQTLECLSNQLFEASHDFSAQAHFQLLNHQGHRFLDFLLDVVFVLSDDSALDLVLASFCYALELQL